MRKLMMAWPSSPLYLPASNAAHTQGVTRQQCCQLSTATAAAACMRNVDNGVTQLILLPAAANNAVHAKHTHQIARLTLSPTNATH
jgi:hypothetical protein